VLCDAQIAKIGPEAKSGKQLLLEFNPVVRAEHWVELAENAVCPLPVVFKPERKTGARSKTLGIAGVPLTAVRLQCGNAVELQVGEWIGQMLFSHCHHHRRIIRRYICSGAQGGLHQPRSSSSGAPCSTRRATGAGSCAGSACPHAA